MQGEGGNDTGWRTSLAAHRFSEASVLAARERDEPPEVLEELEELASVERAVRDKRYGAARRGLARYREEFGEGGRVARDAGLNPEGLELGLRVLEEADKHREQDPEELRSLLAPALEQPLLRPEGLNALGVRHALRGHGLQARESFEQALAEAPSHYRVMTNLGNLLLEEGRPADAEAQYRQALRINPDHAAAHHNLAVALRRQRRMGESVKSLRRGQRLQGDRDRQDMREEAREKFGRLTPAGAKWLRWLLLALAVLVVLFLLRPGA